jgi:hypothetical protein
MAGPFTQPTHGAAPWPALHQPVQGAAPWAALGWLVWTRPARPR